jgi:hypothetical protein
VKTLILFTNTRLVRRQWGNWSKLRVSCCNYRRKIIVILSDLGLGREVQPRIFFCLRFLSVSGYAVTSFP